MFRNVLKTLKAMRRRYYAPALMAAVAAASVRYGSVTEFKRALCAPGDEGGIIQSQRRVPGVVRGWAVTLVATTPGNDMRTFLWNLAARLGITEEAVFTEDPGGESAFSAA